MGRPARHDADALLDAAAALAAEAGPQAVTMSAVARRAGAPSGSVYHRFADRPALLAALWLRTVHRFQDGFFAALDGDPADAAIAVARHVVEWCRAHPAEAAVLLYGARDFAEQDWSEQARAELKKANARVEREVRALAERLARPMDKVVLAVVDLPYSVVRRYLSAGRRLPPSSVELVTESVGALLAAR